MSSELVETRDKKKKGKKGGSTQPPLDGELAKWIERQFRGGESAQSIDCYPLYKGRDREQRLYHYDIKADESVDTERAVELANEIFSDCQLHCDKLPRTALSREGAKTYEVSVVDDRRGGLAVPVGVHLLKLMPRIHGAAPDEDDDSDGLDAEDSDGLSARKMMLETFKEIVGRNERGQAQTGAVVGDIMILQKEMLGESFTMIKDLLREQRASNGEFLAMIREVGRRNVEERAVGIDAANAEVDREFRRAAMAKENMWTDVTRAGMLEGVKVLGQLFPGFGQLFVALMQGKTPPPPPQLPSNGANGASTDAGNGVGAAPTQPQLPESEKALVDSFIEAAEKHKIGDDTAAEKLFGKDDNKGNQIAAGVFTREQVAILTGVHVGSLTVDALDALLPDSGKPEAVKGLQIAQAMAFLTPDMLRDMSRFLEIRKAAKKS